MRKGLLLLLLPTFVYIHAHAQTGIGTTTPNADAALEITSSAKDKGVLIPRIALESTTSPSPLSAHVAGMIVYNTMTSGTLPNEVAPGFYYNDGSKWVRVANSANGDKTDDVWINDYSDDGDDSNDQVKLGTLSDGTTARAANRDFVIKDNGNTGIGTETPKSRLDVNGYVKLGKNDLNPDAGGPLYREGMLRYGSDKTLQYHNDTDWVTVASTATADATKDAWIDDNPNTMTQLGTLSDGTTSRPSGTEVVIKDNGRLGLGTPGPTAKLHVKQGEFRLENQDNWNAYKGVNYSSGPEGHGNKHYPQLFLFYAKGTKAAPKYPLAFNTLGVFRSGNAVDSAGGSGFRVRATNNHSAGSYGSAVTIFTNPNGTSNNIDRLIVDHNGNVGIHHNVDELLLGNSLKSRLSVGGYVQLGSADLTADAATTTVAQRTGMIRYNITTKALQYHDDTQWQTAASSSTADLTKDAWINDKTNMQVKLATLSDGSTTRTEANDVVIKDNGRVGLGTATPSAKLHIKGQVRADSTITAPNYVTAIQPITGSWDLRNGANATWNLAAGSNTLSISNATAGMYGMLKVVNAGSSSITLPSNSKVINNGGGTVWLTQAAGAVDILTFFYDGTSYFWTYGNNYN